MSVITESIEVEVPLTVAYNQWTQFEDFPEFMEGVEEVRQVTDETLEWRARIGGQTRTWGARITEQVPDRRIAWVAVEGEQIDGTVEFAPAGPERTEVSLSMRFEPTGAVDAAGDALNLVEGRVRGDLERFKRFIESRGTETGAWRGEIPPDAKAGEPGATAG